MEDQSSCTFCRIVGVELAAHRVIDDDHVVAFLDTRPLFVGHVLVVPRAHVETLPDLAVAELEPYFERVQRLCHAVMAAFDAPGTFVAMNNTISQSVPHLHTHVVPRRPKDGLRGFFWPRTTYDDDEHMATTAQAIVDALDS